MDSGRLSKGRVVFFAAVGIALGIVVLFFAIANGAWVPVRVPTWPWRTEPYWFAFEARLWGVMLAGFALGAAVTAVLCLIARRSRSEVDPADEDRVHRLERELERVTRLLTLTQNKR